MTFRLPSFTWDPDRALAFAAFCHLGQTDKIGVPYIAHAASVGQVVKDAGGDDLAVMMAYLHDVVEDCGLTEGQLLDLGCPHEVVKGVMLLTRRKDVPPKVYYERLRAAGGRPLLVKDKDIDHNSNEARLARVAEVHGEAEADRLRSKYTEARRELGLVPA